MADYRYFKYGNGSPGIIRTKDGAFIPAAKTNRDYRIYLDWVAAGGVTDPELPPAPRVLRDIDHTNADIVAASTLDELKLALTGDGPNRSAARAERGRSK